MKASLKSIFNSENNVPQVSFVLLIFRVTACVFMLTIGIPKLQILFIDSTFEFTNPIRIGVTAFFILIVYAEFFFSILLIIGLAARVAAIFLLIAMLVAMLIVYASDPLSIKELIFLFSAIYFLLVFTGAGKYSIDYWIYKNR